jgi:hypothetical protein
MALIVLTGAPQGGATTAALSLLYGWPSPPVLLVDADVDVGPIRAGILQTVLGPAVGLPAMDAAARQGLLDQAIAQHCVQLGSAAEPRLVLPGLTDPAQAGALEYSWDALAMSLGGLSARGVDVLVDMGRSGLAGRQAALARTADLVLVVATSTLASITAAAPRLVRVRSQLAATGSEALLGLVVVEASRRAGHRYPAPEIARQLALPFVGTLTHDPEIALYLGTGGSVPRGLERSELVRSGRTLALKARAILAERDAVIGRPQVGVTRG